MQFRCIRCGAISDQALQVCPICWRYRGYEPVVTRPGAIGRVLDVPITTAQELRADGQQRHTFPPPWLSLFPQGFLQPAFLVVFGVPGSGKTSLALTLGDAWPGDTLYLPYEEGLGSTMREKIVRLSISHVHFAIPNNLDSLIQFAGRYRLIIIDSQQALGVEPAALRSMFLDNGQSLILVSQVNAAGDVRGGMASSHLADCSIECPAFGEFLFHKNRYGALTQGQWRDAS